MGRKKKTELALAPLTDSEKQDLQEAETTIRGGLSTFVEVGQALGTIRTRRLYRNGYSDFDEYCKDVWGYGGRYANYQIKGAQLALKLGTIVPTDAPRIEAHIRELAGLPEETQPAAWQEVVEQTDGSPTARDVREVVNKFKAAAEPYEEEPDEDDQPEETSAPPLGIDTAIQEANKALEALARQITSLAKDAADLHNGHLDNRMDILKADLKTAANTVRTAKGHSECVYCGGASCDACHLTGWLTKVQAESAPQ